MHDRLQALYTGGGGGGCRWVLCVREPSFLRCDYLCGGIFTPGVDFHGKQCCLRKKNVELRDRVFFKNYEYCWGEPRLAVFVTKIELSFCCILVFWPEFAGDINGG